MRLGNFLNDYIDFKSLSIIVADAQTGNIQFGGTVKQFQDSRYYDKLEGLWVDSLDVDNNKLVIYISY